MQALQDQWIRESNIFLVCYDIFSAQSFEEAARLLDYLFDFNGGYVIGVLVGTKLVRQPRHTPDRIPFLSWLIFMSRMRTRPVT